MLPRLEAEETMRAAVAAAYAMASRDDRAVMWRRWERTAAGTATGHGRGPVRVYQSADQYAGELGGIGIAVTHAAGKVRETT